MSTTNQTEDQLQSHLTDLLAMLGQGQFLEAQTKYLSDDVVLQEGNDAPKQGKALVMDAESKLLDTVTEFRGYTVTSSAVAGDKTFYEGVMEFVTDGTNVVRVEQVVVDTWKDGQIVHERFYHA